MFIILKKWPSQSDDSCSELVESNQSQLFALSCTFDYQLTASQGLESRILLISLRSKD